MTLKDAKALRDYIRSKGYHCIVPLGHGPAAYAPEISGPRSFQTRAAFRAHHAMRLRERRQALRAYLALVARRPALNRSPIEMMIDRACGLVSR